MQQWHFKQRDYKIRCSTVGSNVPLFETNFDTSRLLFRCATLECEGALLTKAIHTDWIVGAIANNYRPDALEDRLTSDWHRKQSGKPFGSKPKRLTKELNNIADFRQNYGKDFTLMPLKSSTTLVLQVCNGAFFLVVVWVCTLRSCRFGYQQVWRRCLAIDHVRIQ